MDGFEYGQSFKWLLWFLLLEYGFMATLLEPGFLDFDNLPDTNFTCVGKVIGGYYADLETACQMFHVCTIGQLDEPMDIRFLCLNGTVFDQETRVCERIDEVDCAKSEQFYSLNLELYGNTQAPILEQSDEVVGPNDQSTTLRISSTSSEAKITRQSFIITTARPTKITELYKPHHRTPTTTARYQIPINRPPDIRFNPQEINVSLNVRGTDIASSGEHFHQRHHYGGDSKRTASTTERIEHYKISSDITHRTPQKIVRNNQPLIKPTVVRTSTTTTESFEEVEEPFVDYQKEPSSQPLLRNNYQYRLNVPNFRPSAAGLLRHHQHQNHNHRYSHSNRPSIFYSPPKNQQYSSSSSNSNQNKNQHQRLALLQSSQLYYKNYRQQNYQQDYSQTEQAPVKIQLEVPLLPTRQPLTFSSPAPFSLPAQNTNTKHQTVHHRQFSQQSPRIVISASASVSDANGRKFNYSLGTIGDSQLFGHAPQSYDDYREEDVGFDPFYHDVLKLRSVDHRGVRKKRHVQNTTDAIDTLRFLFEWYNRHKSTGDEDISSKWNSSLVKNDKNLTYDSKISTKDFAYADKQRDDDVIYKSVIDTIKQDPYNKMSNYDEYPDYIKEDIYPFANDYVDQNYELKYKSQPFRQTSFETTVPIITTREDITPSIQNQVETTEATQTTAKYEQVLSILGITPHKTNAVQDGDQFVSTLELATEKSTENAEEVLELPISTPESIDLVDSLLFATEAIVTTSQTDGLETDASSTKEIEETTTESVIFGAKIREEYTTMHGLLINKDEKHSVTLEDSLQTITTDIPMLEAITSKDVTDGGVNAHVLVYSTSEIVGTLPTISVAPATLKTTGTSKTVENSLFKNSNHRFNRLRSNIRNKPQKYSSKQVFQITTTTDSYKNYLAPPSLTTEINQVSEYLGSKSYSLQEDVSKNLTKEPTGKSIEAFKKDLSLKRYIFNCFGKDLHQFYSDPRDCRLFHYCTNGFTSTQLLDMKFVCDLGTFFDNEKLVCTKDRPSRCI